MIFNVPFQICAPPFCKKKTGPVLLVFNCTVFFCIVGLIQKTENSDLTT